MSLKVYIAGPDVFYPDAKAIGDAKRAICKKHGFEGVFPLDLLPTDLFSSKYSHKEQAKIIQKACIEGIRSCDILVANMTPFRGASMDIGTGVELGAAHMINKPVFGYSMNASSYLQKVMSADKNTTSDGTCFYDGQGQLIEDMDEIDNCMTTESCHAIIFPDNDLQTHVDLFEKTIIYIKEQFNA